MRFAERKRVIRSECNTLRAEELDQQPERVGIVHERIDVEPRGRVAVGEITSRIRFVVGRAQVRADMKRVLDPADR